jgi:hypothetical protein
MIRRHVCPHNELKGRHKWSHPWEGRYSGVFGEYPGEFDEHSGECGEHSGECGEYSGECGEYSSECGEYSGEFSPNTPVFLMAIRRNPVIRLTKG